MSPWEVLRSALAGIGGNVTRAALTLLGVLIGVGSVILLLGVGSGATANVAQQIEGLGSNTITISAGFSRGATRFQDLTLDAAEALQAPDAAPDIAEVVPQVSTSATVAYGVTSTSATVTGTTANYFTVTNSPVAIGTPFRDEDTDGARKVAVIGASLAEDLFDQADPVGRTITIGTTPFTVYGVLHAKDTSGGTSANSGIVIPITRAQRSLTGYTALSSITVQAASAEVIDAAAAEAELVVAESLGVTTEDATFTVTTQSQLLEASTSVGSTLSAMLAAIAAISLVVGGIGVTNIMLVTVSERTREIGIRKALGATGAAISAQFILEATLLSLAGGALGVAAAMGASHVEILGTRPVISAGSVLLAAGVSIAIGVFFGGYPAIRASLLTPVAALRHD
ncbi:MAG: ABC transporter permease [Bifidobacteriaceae bacterium]|jgi:putative ABC transport system permease protein|nr:ABC transporter permease [Bifidobacteriaceae bacterium]